MVILLVDAELERGKGKETGCFGQKKTLLKDKRRRKSFCKKLLKGKWLSEQKILYAWIKIK